MARHLLKKDILGSLNTAQNATGHFHDFAKPLLPKELRSGGGGLPDRQPKTRKKQGFSAMLLF